MLIGAGVLLQLNKLGFLRLSFADLWPLAIIGIGILMIWGSLESRGIIRRKIKFDWTQASAAQKFREHLTELTGETDTSFNAAAVFGGCDIHPPWRGEDRDYGAFWPCIENLALLRGLCAPPFRRPGSTRTPVARKKDATVCLPEPQSVSAMR